MFSKKKKNLKRFNFQVKPIYPVKYQKYFLKIK